MRTSLSPYAVANLIFFLLHKFKEVRFFHLAAASILQSDYYSYLLYSSIYSVLGFSTILTMLRLFYILQFYSLVAVLPSFLRQIFSISFYSIKLWLSADALQL